MSFQKKQRAGVLAEKVGVRTIFDKNHVAHKCTILQVKRNVVIDVRSRDEELEYKGYKLKPYKSLVVAYGTTKKQSKPLAGIAKKARITPFRRLKEFRVSQDFILPMGALITANYFAPNQRLDISGTTVGKGFQGGIKRHNFAGLEASHGVSLTHRSIGSTGNREFPGRVFPGKKMPGRMGGKKATVSGVHLIEIYEDLLIVKGALPGKVGSVLIVRDSKSHPIPNIEFKSSSIHDLYHDDNSAGVENSDSPVDNGNVDAAAGVASE